MSLSTLLLGGQSTKGANLDAGLDDIFRTSAAPVRASPSKATPIPTPGSSKRKHAETEPVTALPTVFKPFKKKTRLSNAMVEAAEDHSLEKPSKKVKKTKSTTSLQPDDASDSDDAGLEDAYLAKAVKPAPSKTSALSDEDTFKSDDKEGDDVVPIHESVAKEKRKRDRKSGARKEKYVPADETPAMRNARTIFIGNVPAEATKSRPMQKQLKRHVLAHVPLAKIESLRFRSVAFAQPTATLPSESLSDLKKGREHDRARAASWREAYPEEEAALKQDAKRYQTPKEKKRVAAIRHDLHPEADSANVYMVFAHAKPGASLREADTAKDDSDSEEADSGVDKQPTQRASTLDPYEAARLAAQKCDGTSFLNRTLRVDVVHTPKSLSGSAETSSGTSPDGLFDPKRTVFVGNLDFASKEEDLRAFFEGVVARERGPPPSIESVNGKEEDEEDKGTRDGAWVARVRIVRDRDTQLGKGFAYVQFTDRECVDELLAVEEGTIKFAKRKLRLQRCKTVPSGPSAAKSKPSTASSAASGKVTRGEKRANPPKPAATPISIPAGDPTLGARLASLSKEDRKAAKAADTDRLARRAAKKAAKSAKAKSDKMQRKDIGDINKGRKKKGPGAARKEVKKRVLSERAVGKRNVKK